MSKEDQKTPQAFNRAILYDGDWEPANVMTEQMKENILDTLAVTQQPLPAELQMFCPLNRSNAKSLFDRYATGSYDDRYEFQNTLQLIINHMAKVVPTIAIEGQHGVGKTELLERLRDLLEQEGIETALTKYNGFVEPKEAHIYTHISPAMKKKLAEASALRSDTEYLSNVNNIRPGEISWGLLKQHWIQLACELYDKEKKVILCDRGPGSRMHSSSKDKNSEKFLNPFAVEVDLPYFNAKKGMKRGFYSEYFGVIVPMPYIIFLFEEQGVLDRRLTEQGELSRAASNRKNFNEYTPLAADFDSLLSDFDMMSYISASSPDITEQRVLNIVRRRIGL